MSDLAPVQAAHIVAPWEPLPEEAPAEHMQFLHWAHHGGPLIPELADLHRWSARAQALATLRDAPSDPYDQASKAALEQVQIVFAEISKLHRSALESPSSVLAPQEVFNQMQVITDKVEGLQQRRADLQDYSLLTPKEREIMIEAERIQRERLGGF